MNEQKYLLNSFCLYSILHTNIQGCRTSNEWLSYLDALFAGTANPLTFLPPSCLFVHSEARRHAIYTQGKTMLEEGTRENYFLQIPLEIISHMWIRYWINRTASTRTATTIQGALEISLHHPLSKHHQDSLRVLSRCIVHST